MFRNEPRRSKKKERERKNRSVEGWRPVFTHQLDQRHEALVPTPLTRVALNSTVVLSGDEFSSYDRMDPLVKPEPLPTVRLGRRLDGK